MHEETPNDDFARQPQLPRKLTQLGPGLALGDADGDGDEDHYVVRDAADARDLELLEQLASAKKEIARQISQRIVGQHEIVESLTSAILAGGHVLLV
jgi:hypothetical protein